MGMNDEENSAMNIIWKDRVDKLIDMCDKKGIEIILCTIPSTPIRDHSYKNAYVKSSGKRYVDIAHCVGADISNNWFNGLLGTDNIHPTNNLGTKTITTYMMVNVPELIN